MHLGDLDDLAGLTAVSSTVDGVIHLAFKHDLMITGDFEGAIEADLAAIAALADGLAGSGKPFVGTTGTLMTIGTVDRTATEDDPAGQNPRGKAENAVLALAERGIRSSVVRLPPTVHSDLDKHGFIRLLIATARQHGKSGYLGDGGNRWPAGHTLDAARLYRLALEQAPAGSRLNAVGDEGVPFREIAEVIGRHLDVPVVQIPDAEAAAHFGFLASVVPLDNPTSAKLTRERVGWEPVGPGLIADLDAGHYFQD
ncbi:oxidoreductase [Amycolatopsis bartoniae]|uniref:Oxidoreductase n=1 Tax=Amycolatopsis bartoniae TaxID=941986 RepID=A0A8H9MBG3_9PSEU|nr:oxidoreductase [Amycolatopsis bartoniae]